MSRQKVSTECRKTVSSHCHKKVSTECRKTVSSHCHKTVLQERFRMVSTECRKTVSNYCHKTVLQEWSRSVSTMIRKDAPTIRIYRMVVLLSALSKKVYAPIRQVIFVKKKLRQVFVQRLCGMIPTMNGMRRF